MSDEDAAVFWADSDLNAGAFEGFVHGRNASNRDGRVCRLGVRGNAGTGDKRQRDWAEHRAAVRRKDRRVNDCLSHPEAACGHAALWRQDEA